MNLKLVIFAVALILPGVAGMNGALAAKSDSCAHCHGTDGNSTSSAYPSLAGQTKDYLYRQMKDFKEGRRKNSMMTPSIGVLSDTDMQELADYFSAQSIVRSKFEADPAKVEQGKKIAQEAQCTTCHQSGFKGLNEFPRLSRQKYPYLVKQLKDYRDGTRTNDNGVMAPAAKNLSDDQIEALAHYLASF
ncbi:MAG TPA: c-type cytochrome [Burkholderiales bacterium]|nr:c-type cytochrome [Burkholderiales bacterium]